jgi:transcriptional regulator of acetoin/glycerol metabolism
MVEIVSQLSAAAISDHADRVCAIAEGDGTAMAAEDDIATSWQRCAKTYGIDPVSREAPRILTRGELRDVREPLDRLIADAQKELDHLYKIVGRAKYVVLLCDNKGVAVDHRGNQADAPQFKYWGTWLGGVWAEEIEGTNGIGTCIAGERPVTIHQGQHFRARHISLSCSGAPIFDGDGKLAAVLDVSSIDPDLSERSHALTGALTEASARAIEERSFRERFGRAWVVAVAPPEGTAMLLAADRDGRIVGADRNARAMLSRNNLILENGVSLWALFKCNDAVFRSKDRGDLSVRLTPTATAELWRALITPPARASETRRHGEKSSLNGRPRLTTTGLQQKPVMPYQARGGLSPRTLQRVREYIDSHLQENIRLEALAAAAGLSMFHFARAFRQSEGLTPHSFLIQQRVERAEELLTRTDLPLSQIALATGFSDQSHLARHFRRRFGVAPSTFRRSKR